MNPLGQVFISSRPTRARFDEFARNPCCLFRSVRCSPMSPASLLARYDRHGLHLLPTGHRLWRWATAGSAATYGPATLATLAAPASAQRGPRLAASFRRIPDQDEAPALGPIP